MAKRLRMVAGDLDVAGDLGFWAEAFTLNPKP